MRCRCHSKAEDAGSSQLFTHQSTQLNIASLRVARASRQLHCATLSTNNPFRSRRVAEPVPCGLCQYGHASTVPIQILWIKHQGSVFGKPIMLGQFIR